MPRPPGRSTSLARRADKYELYQRAVQAPDADIAFLERVARRHSGRAARRLREDFCGTALLSSRWVARGPRNTAIAIDVDAEPLAWARKHNVGPLGEDAVPESAINVGVDVSKYVDVKRAAMRAHASQIPEQSFFLALDDETFARTFGTEWFHREGHPPSSTLEL